MERPPMTKEERQKIGKIVHDKKKLKKKLGHVCVYCGCNNKLILTIDHIIPKSRGGSDEPQNKQVTCLICNHLKGSLTEQEFRKYLKSLFLLEEICKVKLQITQINLKFNQGYYPTGNVVEFKDEAQK
jgi:5-methylcytosine-specific restriction endonuclease McrA